MIVSWFRKLVPGLAFAILFSALHFGLWALANRALPLISVKPAVNGFAYSGYRGNQSPLEGQHPSTAELAQDLDLMHKHTRHIRMYSSLDLNEVVPLAARRNMNVIAGAWIDTDNQKNTREVSALLEKLENYSNIDRVIVGNEALLRNDLPVQSLIGYLDFVREHSNVPVSTAEPWHVWLKHPELVKHVDYIAVHLLPYHEGVPVEKAVQYTIERYNQLMQAYPRKKIVITEVGWPSRGPAIGASVASEVNQARFIREFLARNSIEDLDFYLMEAFDQPWKVALEGWAGAYWGMYNADRHQKYSLQGAVPPNTRWIAKATWSSLLAFIPLMLIAWRFKHWGIGGVLSMAVLFQACITTLTIAWNLPGDYYYTLRDFVVLIGLILGIALTSMVLMIYAAEFSEVMFKPAWRRLFKRAQPLPADQELFVSIHLACYNEPPEMVIATIDSLRKLNYSRYEVIVVDNNTKDEAKWKPLETYMATMPDHFHFYHLPSWPGFKAGALNFALEKTHPDAQVVGVVDADYVVTPDWLSDLVPHFQESQVAVVQAPQAHREWENHFFHRMCNWEFEGFFRIGMHHRHERNALIQHGTMTLIRRVSLQTLGGWSEWCICEDTELGLRLLENNMELRYIDETFGRGLTPANFKALKSQRNRWAFGAMQILKHHMPKLLGKSSLNFSQRYHFLTGWFGWFGEALQLVFTIGSIGWTIAMLAFPKYFSLPVVVMIVPILCFLAIKAILGPVLYRKTMHCSWTDIFGASLASLGLSHAIARGIINGLTHKAGVFVVTNKTKAKLSNWQLIDPIKEELLILVSLILSAAAMLYARGFSNLDAQLWVSMLALQSLPYWSALACQWISERK
ncbi:glycosyltransferase [Methylophilus sp.]|uniref:glycosyltransferase n=1 Tax=Methylophilus sp. TaxID=29541 RepID=UPI0011D89013|nr:glycosyltransferase [Methylophilus sp.]TXI44804.1 MAG: glycosyltransferase [Methylophilus sp.]